MYTRNKQVDTTLLGNQKINKYCYFRKNIFLYFYVYNYICVYLYK